MGVLISCSPLEPIDEPEVSDLQLTADTLKTSLRDAQRTIAELRAEVESRRQELADAQIARAQLEGRLREAERRLAEARHVIDLQREELAGARSERERVAKSGAMLRSQLRQLQLQLAKMARSSGESRAAGVAAPAVHLRDSPAAGGLPGSPPARNNPARVSVKPGDTLWSIAQRHRVSVKRLMALNHLADSHIQVGQALWLIDPAAAGGSETAE
jgi:LysM repeat protein